MTRFSLLIGRSMSLVLSVAGLIATLGAAAPQAPGPLQVQVRWVDGGAPVDRALVRLGGRFAATGKDGNVVFDGVPAGKFGLVVDHPEGVRVARNVTLVAGHREPIRVVLVRCPAVDITGTVVLADTGQPVPGARVALLPRGVGASCQGRFDFVADWAGGFAVREVPAGAYTAQVEMPGCADLTFAFEVAPGAEPLVLQLAPVTEPASLEIVLRDAVGGAPVVGASVVLAGGWPKGEIGRGESDAEGRVTFSDLAVGQLNWAGEDGALRVARRRATVRVEAPGYEPTLELVSLRAGARAEITVNPDTMIAEREPNDGPEQAQEIRSGAPVEFRLETVGDVDFFALAVPEPAFLTITVGPKNPLSIHAELFDGEGRRIAEQSTYSGSTNTIALGVQAGRHLLKIEEWGRDAAHAATLTLRVTRQTAADVLEPNDTPQTARILRAGEEVRGTVLPLGDVDWFRFVLEEDGTVRFTIPPHGISREVVVLDEGGQERGKRSVYANSPLALVVPLEAGRYVVGVREWGDDAESIEPYTLRFDHAPGDGVRDVAGARLSAGRTLEPGSLVGATVGPLRDRDLFAVPLETAGLLHLRLRASTDLEVHVLDGRGQRLASAQGYRGNVVGLTWNAEAPTVAFVEVREWGDNAWSASPYTLRAWWDPCDEHESLARNDDLGSATPVELGEVLRGSIAPLRDRDLFRFDFDHPGYLSVRGPAATDTTVRILDAAGGKLAERSGYSNGEITVGADVPAGPVFVEVREWGDNVASVASYAFATSFVRAERFERSGALRDDPARLLRVGEAQSFVVDQLRDRDRFMCEVPRAGKVTFTVRAPLAVEWAVFDDRTGERVLRKAQYANGIATGAVEAKGPTRYRIELGEWGDNDRSAEPAFVFVDLDGRPLCTEKIDVIVDPIEPTQVTFRRRPWKGGVGAVEVRIDADGDGNLDGVIPPDGEATFRLPAEGRYLATAVLVGPQQQQTRCELWVDAVGPRVREGVQVRVLDPAPDAIVDTMAPARVRAISYTGVPVREVSLAIDGRTVATAYRSPYELQVPWRALGAGEHELRFVARDVRGQVGEATRRVRVSDYFDLQPADGAVLSGDAVKVSWRGSEFGPARVRVRAQGEEEWREVVGQNARDRRVALAELEPGRAYEFQPVGGDEPGPVRAVTRVEGLAFGRAVYGANIARDYDQRVAISVRNHAEAAQTVTLTCGEPDGELLLVGFVGDGSEGAPFELAPGEEREFLLGISAQDVLRAEHAFPVRIASAEGYSDEARVELHVRLPKVDLAWIELGPTEDGLGRRLRIENRGDPLTDLRIGTGDDGLRVTPAIEHGMFARGARRDVVVRPKLFEGFERASGEVFAQGLAEQVRSPVEIALPEGEALHRVQLLPGYGPDGKAVDDEAELLAARALAGFYLDPESVDWSRRQDPEDTDGDGRPDRWSVRDELEGVLWVGDDGDGDGEVDFVRGDVWWDGQFDYAAFRVEDGWEQTNLVDAWLEMGFKLPWSRDAYEKHDVDLVLNGQVVGELRDQIPEGNYSFRLPPSALRFPAGSSGAEQDVEIRSEHLRGGHYVVSSDFELRTRMTGTHVWATGTSAEDARTRALGAEGLTLDRPDFSVSSSEIHIDAPAVPKMGDEVAVEVPIRNLGALGAHDVAVALVRRGPDGEDVELARQYVEDIPLVGEKSVRFAWQAGAGDHALRVVIDPDGELGEWSRGNNEARFVMKVAGDDAPPTMRLEGLDGLESGAVLRDTLFAMRAHAEDDGGVARIEARIDDGLWRELPGMGGARDVRGLLQPGDHTIAVRAIDGAGNRTQAELPLTIDVPTPEAMFVEPEDGAEIADISTPVRIRTGPDVAKAMVRVNGGPWIRAPIQNGVAEARVPVGFGPSEVEAMVVDGRGVRKNLKRPFRGMVQPVPGADGFRPDYVVDDFRLPFDHFGDIDLLTDPDFLFTDPEPDVPDPTVPDPTVPDPTVPEPDVRTPGDPPVPPPAVDPEAPPAERAPWNPTWDAPPRPAGGVVATRSRQSSAYCTNRPKIKVPFRLPDWLMRKDLPPPGSIEFELMIDKMIGQLWAQGVDTKGLERFQKFLERKCMQLEDPRELPGWLESVGLGGDAKISREELKKRREQMLDRTRAWWLRLLASGDPALIQAGLRARMDAFRKFDDGLSENAQAAIDMIGARQTLIEDLIEGLPVAGEGMDLYAVITGERILNGKQITTFERVIRAGGLLAPKILEQIFKRSKLAQKGAVYVAEKLTVAGKWGKNSLSALTKIPTRDIDTFLVRVQRALTSEISLTKWRMNRQATAAGRAFEATAEGAADLARQAEDLTRARRLISQLDDVADEQAFERMVLDAFQTNKTAQRVVNSDAATDALRARINRSLRNVYESVDGQAADQMNRILRASDDELALLAHRANRNFDELRRFRDNIHDLARRNGIDPSDLRVRSQDFSGIDPSNPGRSVGRDRDVTYAVFGPDGKHLEDVHHAISRDVYEDALWIRTRGEPLGDIAAVRAHAAALDQMVTSRWHPEAYAFGETGFRNFLNGTGSVSRVEDVIDTFNVKSQHWWHMAANEADPILRAQQVAEGMRQATKQWDRIIEPRVAQYMRNTSLAAQIKVPTDLQVGIDIFRRVETGAITPRQADEMLNAIGMTKESVLTKITGFFEATEKGVGRQFKRIGAAQLDDLLSRVPQPKGTQAWGNGALDQINDALKNGYVTEQAFLARRQSVLASIQGEVQRQASPGAFSAFETWIYRAQSDLRISRLEARALREWVDENR